MNKQQLANKIWAAANKMRSKIEANEYKDYILGFIFYKFLSDKEVEVLKKDGWTDDDLPELTEEDSETKEYLQTKLGYFIAYKNLYSTWLKDRSSFSSQNVTDALNAFNRLIGKNHKRVFDKIFFTLQTGITKLGDTAQRQTKSISDLLDLIKDIPTDDREDYDVLGFIYEYLIGNFAANAGKKAGEFYTPHEVAIVMAEIVAWHLRDKKNIQIYDPTSGSASLLLNIGHAVSRHTASKNAIKYYAQELKEATFNLTRMNLVMRGISPSNIVVRNGDTLEEDWPFFDENHTYDLLRVDAVVSNPPYSQPWEPKNKEGDPRFKKYGLAPKGKADYAFLLHDLYHLQPDGIMTIVLPHGVLFRGGEEEKIRKNLIEENNIDAIIGLPAGIFFGTGIPTIVMVLRQNRSSKENDVLIIDASKGFVKEGKNNKLRACDIKKIVDTYTGRKKVEKFSRVVSRDEIRANGYNLNIPRYVDSSEAAETWDIYASMFGGIPNSEIDVLNDYWKAFPSLRDELFAQNETPFSALNVENVKTTIGENADVKKFFKNYNKALKDFPDYLKATLIENMKKVKVAKAETEISNTLFAALEKLPLVDKYQAYQILSNKWQQIATDLEIIQTEGFAATKQVDPNMVIKKKDGKEEEVQEGWLGHVLPFDLVQEKLLTNERDALLAKQLELENMEGAYSEIIDSLSEDEREKYVDDEKSEFISAKVSEDFKVALKDVETDEIRLLNEYISLPKKQKADFIASHKEVCWEKITPNKDGSFGKGDINKYIAQLQRDYKFEEGSIESKLSLVTSLIEKEKNLKSQIKSDSASLHTRTKETIENLNDSVVLELIEQKWIGSLLEALAVVPSSIVDDFEAKVKTLAEKYSTTYHDVNCGIKDAQKELSKMLGDLTGDDFDMKGIAEFKGMLK